MLKKGGWVSELFVCKVERCCCRCWIRIVNSCLGIGLRVVKSLGGRWWIVLIVSWLRLEWDGNGEKNDSLVGGKKEKFEWVFRSNK